MYFFLCVCQFSRQRGSVDGDDLHGSVTIRQVRTDFILFGDDRHPIMDLDHGLVGRAGQNDKPHLSIDDLIYAAEIEHWLIPGLKEILCFLSLVAPFIKAEGRENGPALLQAVCKRLLLRYGLRTGIYQEPVPVKAREAKCCRNRQKFSVLLNDCGRSITGKDFAGFVCAGIPSIHHIHDSVELLIVCHAREIVAPAHNDHDPFILNGSSDTRWTPSKHIRSLVVSRMIALTGHF